MTLIEINGEILSVEEAVKYGLNILDMGDRNK